MADTFIKCFEYNGHDLTIELRENTGTTPIYDSNGNIIGTENTHTIWAAMDNLSSATVTATSAGSTLTDSGLANKWVTALTINGSAKIYAGIDDAGVTHFSKPLASNTITTVDGITAFAISDSVTYYYLPDGTGDVVPGIRKKDIADILAAAIKSLKVQVDAISDNDIYRWATAIGLARN